MNVEFNDIIRFDHQSCSVFSRSELGTILIRKENTIADQKGYFETHIEYLVIKIRNYSRSNSYHSCET
jgi:hypothetical protein